MSVGSRSTQQEHRGEKFLSTVAVEFLGSTASSSRMPLSLLMDDHVYYGVCIIKTSRNVRQRLRHKMIYKKVNKVILRRLRYDVMAVVQQVTVLRPGQALGRRLVVFGTVRSNWASVSAPSFSDQRRQKFRTVLTRAKGKLWRNMLMRLPSSCPPNSTRREAFLKVLFKNTSRT